jgi:thiamine pyrophosphate-dependent acetolactate synthase large subunit-like protein
MGALIMANAKASNSKSVKPAAKATSVKSARKGAKASALERRAVVRKLLENRNDLLVVCGLGSSTYDVFAAGDDDRNVYLWGAMGGAAMIGLGLAIAQPKKQVLVITGDGEQLMGLGALATIGAQAPKNLAIVVLDNTHYAETGMQKSHTALGVNMSAVAAACGFRWSGDIDSMAGLGVIREQLARFEGPSLAKVTIEASEPPRALPLRDGVEMKNRFRRALGLQTM